MIPPPLRSAIYVLSAHRDVCAVIVTYNPALAEFSALLKALAPQVVATVVIDNASKPEASAAVRALIGAGDELIQLEDNTGLASAQNRGIAWARDRGYEYVILFDQDSEPGADMVGRLKSAHIEASVTRKVSAAGPRYIDRDRGFASYFVRFGRFSFRKVRCDAELRPVETDFLISSGSLISLQAIEHIGGMDDALFIDHIDTEWFLRARAKGYVSIGVCAAEMRHSLGAHTIRIPLMPSRNVAVHAPLRDYYMFRNSILLMKRAYVPNVWRVNDALRLLGLFGIFMLFVPDRAQRLRMIVRGIYDGVRNRSGRL